MKTRDLRSGRFPADREEAVEERYGESKTVRVKNPNKLIKPKSDKKLGRKRKRKYKKKIGRPKKPGPKPKPKRRLTKEEKEQRRIEYKEKNDQRKEYFGKYWTIRTYTDPEEVKARKRKQAKDNSRKRKIKKMKWEAWRGITLKDENGTVYHSMGKTAKKVGVAYITFNRHKCNRLIPPALYKNHRGHSMYSEQQIKLMRSVFRKTRKRQWTLGQASQYLYDHWKDNENL